jgi:hypothetical protein
VPAAAAVLALALAGCGTRESGAAAVVGDRRIPVASVQSAYRDIVPLLGQDQRVDQAQILNLLILEPYLTKAASALGRGVSDNDARLSIRSAAQGQDLSFTRPGLEVWRANLAISAVQSGRSESDVKATFADLEKQLKSAGVHINPRYGAGIDYTDFTIRPEQPNWLVTPKPAAGAGAAPTAPAQPQSTDPAQPEPSRPGQPEPSVSP